VWLHHPPPPLVGRQLAPWRKSKRRRLIETSKFYFFDTGLVSALLGQASLAPGTAEYGRAFEHFIMQECWAYRQYGKHDFDMAYWRSASGSEVDLILGDAEAAVEIKSTEHAPDGTKGIHLFTEEHPCRKKYIVSRDRAPRKLASGVLVLPWEKFCRMLWTGEII
jgi:predicted AAA+ superfamily ATPase